MHTGRRFADRYLLPVEATAGGMGTVYRAIDGETGDTIALKIVHVDSADERDRFEREAAILRQLEHPGIVRYLDHGVAPDGACYLAMDWVHGTTLAERLIVRGVSAHETLAIVRQVGEALAEVHRLGIVHRDVKPANIMLTGDDLAVTRLIDFGAARRIREVHKLTQTGLTVGTPGYMAPEQARGARAIDARADLFALGCVLYECTTGRPAFSGDHATAVRAKILADEPLPPRAFVDLLEPVEQLILDLLAKDPSDRPASAEVFLAALERAGVPLDGPPRRRHAVDAPTRRMVAPEVAEGVVFVVLANLGAVMPIAGGDREVAARFRAAGMPHGARIEVMSDGCAFGVIREPGDSVRPGRLALAIRAAVPTSVPVVVAFAAGDNAFARAIERAVTLLGDAEVEAAIRTSGSGLLWLDADASALLASAFEIEDDGVGRQLGRERDAPVG